MVRTGGIYLGIGWWSLPPVLTALVDSKRIYELGKDRPFRTHLLNVYHAIIFRLPNSASIRYCDTNAI
jgi:hypothetical protein